MRVGIVGSEGAKFTPLGEERARELIQKLINGADLVVSGECHLGGIDIYAHEEADRAGIPFLPCPPAEHNWDKGYKPRNLKIARESDIVHCISVDALPGGFKGMKFSVCYHCVNAGRDGMNHVKSGGCWTVNQGLKMGKQGVIHVVGNY